MTMVSLDRALVEQQAACGLLLCCYSSYFKIPVSVVTHGHTEQVGHGLGGCGHLAMRLSLLWP